MPTDISLIINTVNHLASTNTFLVELIEKQQKQLERMETIQIEQNDNINSLKTIIKREISKECIDLVLENSTTIDDEEIIQPEGHLLIGDSLLRNIYSTSKDLHVHSPKWCKIKRYLDITQKHTYEENIMTSQSYVVPTTYPQINPSTKLQTNIKMSSRKQNLKQTT